MERDLCYLMEYGDEDNRSGYNTDDYDRPSFSSRELGAALTFADMIAEEELSNILESVDSCDPEELLEALELERDQKETRVSLKTRHGQTDVPAFEQYVYAKCGISR